MTDDLTNKREIARMLRAPGMLLDAEITRAFQRVGVSYAGHVPYSTDIKAAWILLDSLPFDCMPSVCRISLSPHELWAAAIWVYDERSDGNKVEFEAEAATLPHAICLVWLEWFEWYTQR